MTLEHLLQFYEHINGSWGCLTLELLKTLCLVAHSILLVEILSVHFFAQRSCSDCVFELECQQCQPGNLVCQHVPAVDQIFLQQTEISPLFEACLSYVFLASPFLLCSLVGLSSCQPPERKSGEDVEKEKKPQTPHTSWMCIMCGMRWASQGRIPVFWLSGLGVTGDDLEKQVLWVLWVWSGFSHSCLAFPGLENDTDTECGSGQHNWEEDHCIKATASLQE